MSVIEPKLLSNSNQPVQLNQVDQQAAIEQVLPQITLSLDKFQEEEVLDKAKRVVFTQPNRRGGIRLRGSILDKINKLSNDLANSAK